MKTAVFAGSFDPITKGHEDIVRRAYSLFDRVIVAVGTNSGKNGLFSVEQRLKYIRQTFVDLENVEAASYEGLTIDFCNSMDAHYLLRGVRNGIDLSYEQQIADLNRRIAPEIETVLLMSKPELVDISSSAVRELLRYGRSVSDMIPSRVQLDLGAR